MWQVIISLVVANILPILIVGIGIPLAILLSALAKKGKEYLFKKWDLDISEREQYMIDGVVENAVRAVEERTKTTPMDSDCKENLALNIVKAELGDKVVDVSLRNKIKATVSTIRKSF